MGNWNNAHFTNLSAYFKIFFVIIFIFQKKLGLIKKNMANIS